MSLDPLYCKKTDLALTEMEKNFLAQSFPILILTQPSHKARYLRDDYKRKRTQASNENHPRDYQALSLTP